MKSKIMTCLVGLFFVQIGFLLGFPKEGRAQSTDIEFFCGSVGSQFATIARTPSDEGPVVIWENSLGGFTPQERCEIISGRFQRYFAVEGKNFISLFNLNGLPVLCAVSTTERLLGCEGELFTVSSWNYAKAIRQQMESVPWYLQGPIRQSGSEYVVFDLEAYVENEIRNNSEILLLSQ